MSLETIALVKDPKHSTAGRVFFTGDISALAQKTGYLQVDDSGNPLSQGGGWFYSSRRKSFDWRVPEGHLDFDPLRLRDALVANGLLEEGIAPCVTSLYTWPSIVEFRKVDQAATDVVVRQSSLYREGTLYEKISPSLGALAVNVTCFLEKPDGMLVRAPPGVMSYPASWVEMYGSPDQKYLGVWYSYVDGGSSLGASSRYASSFAVLADILTLEHDSPRAPCVAYSHDSTRFAITLALRAHEVQDWVASSFGLTLHRLMEDTSFREAVALRNRQTAVQFNDFEPRYAGITAALLAKDPVPQQLPRDLAEMMGVYTRTHYTPLVKGLVEKVHADPDMTRMMQLL